MSQHHHMQGFHICSLIYDVWENKHCEFAFQQFLSLMWHLHYPVRQGFTSVGTMRFLQFSWGTVQITASCWDFVPHLHCSQTRCNFSEKTSYTCTHAELWFCKTWNETDLFPNRNNFAAFMGISVMVCMSQTIIQEFQHFVPEAGVWLATVTTHLHLSNPLTCDSSASLGWRWGNNVHCNFTQAGRRAGYLISTDFIRVSTTVHMGWGWMGTGGMVGQ